MRPQTAAAQNDYLWRRSEPASGRDGLTSSPPARQMYQRNRHSGHSDQSILPFLFLVVVVWRSSLKSVNVKRLGLVCLFLTWFECFFFYSFRDCIEFLAWNPRSKNCASHLKTEQILSIWRTFIPMSWPTCWNFICVNCPKLCSRLDSIRILSEWPESGRVRLPTHRHPVWRSSTNWCTNFRDITTPRWPFWCIIWREFRPNTSRTICPPPIWVSSLDLLCSGRRKDRLRSRRSSTQCTRPKWLNCSSNTPKRFSVHPILPPLVYWCRRPHPPPLLLPPLWLASVQLTDHPLNRPKCWWNNNNNRKQRLLVPLLRPHPPAPAPLRRRHRRLRCCPKCPSFAPSRSWRSIAQNHETQPIAITPPATLPPSFQHRPIDAVSSTWLVNCVKKSFCQDSWPIKRPIIR